MTNERMKVAEVVNGRIAMLGITTLLLIEMINGGALSLSISLINIPSFWWQVGVYAS